MRVKKAKFGATNDKSSQASSWTIEAITALFEAVDIAVYVSDPVTYELIYMNRHLRELMGDHTGELCHKALQNMDEPCPFCSNGTIFGSGLGESLVWDLRNKRDEHWYRCVDKAIDWFDGRKVRLELAVNIDQLKKSEQNLKKSEEMFRSLSETAQDGIIVLDSKERIQVWNPAAERIFGWSMDEVLGRPLHEFVIPPNMEDLHLDWFRAFVDTGKLDRMMELPWLRKDGARVPVEVSLSSFVAGGVRYLVGIVRDISERKRAERALRRAKKEAEAAAEAKGQFLANMSHEIRTPMNGVIGMSSLLLDLDLTDEQREYAETIQSSAGHLMNIINDILDFSKMEAGKLDLEVIDFDLRLALEEMDDVLAYKAQQKGLEYVCLVRPQVPSLLKGDPGRLRRVLINLVGNSIKFTEHGSVEIIVDLVSQDDDMVRLMFSVRDTGIGIEKEKLDKIFRAFEQADGSTTREFGGTGLGLSISREIVEMMEGNLQVESEPGSGSVFWFEAEFELQDEAEQTSEEQETENILGMRVLVVDGNATNREVLISMLRPWGCEVVLEQCPAKVLNLMREASRKKQAFDVVLLDKCMPEMDGEQLGEHISRDDEINRTHLVMLSSIGLRGDAARLENMGFSAYLTKPVKNKHLRACLFKLARWHSRRFILSKNPSS